MSTMSANQAHLLELQVAMQECYLNGDIEGAEQYQQMMDEFEEYMEEE